MLPAGVMIGEFVMLKAQKVQDCGMQIPEMNLVFHGTGPGIIGAAMHMPALHPATCKPESKAMRIMPGFVLFIAGGQARTPELTTPNNKGIIQQAP